MKTEIKKKEDLKFAILATDIVCFRIIDNKLTVLLGRVTSNSIYKNWWAAIGGLIRASETADQSAERLLAEKPGIKKIYKEQLYTFSRLDRDPRGRVISVAYLALAGSDPQEKEQASIETYWAPVSDLPKLAYDHEEVLGVALERLRAKIGYTNIAQFLLPKQFTFSEFQKVYELVLGKGVDKRNFRKKIAALQVLKDTGLVKRGGAMRPAALFEFSSKKLEVFKIE